jgi:hypothetical protein
VIVEALGCIIAAVRELVASTLEMEAVMVVVVVVASPVILVEEVELAVVTAGLEVMVLLEICTILLQLVLAVEEVEVLALITLQAKSIGAVEA